MWQKFFNVSKKNVFPLKPPRTRFQAWKISRKTFSHSVYHISENNTSHKQRSSDVLKKNKQTNSPKIERTQTIYINSWNAVRKVWTEKRPNSFRIWSGSDRVSCPPPGPCLQSIRPPLWSTTLLLLLATSLSPSSSPTLPVLPSASSPSTATQRTRTTGSSPLPGELIPWLWTLELKK